MKKSLLRNRSPIKFFGIISISKPHHYLYWASITSAIPHKRKILMKDADFNTFHDASSLSRNCNGTRITSRDVYLSFVQTKFKKPTAQAHFLKRVDSQIDWDSVYRRIYNMSIDPYTRFFQYKILNNCLYLNRDLFRLRSLSLLFALSAPCFQKQSIAYLFIVYCLLFIYLFIYLFYREIRIWTKSVGIVLPELNIPNFILGVDSEKHSPVINFSLLILTVYKLLLYRSISGGLIPNLQAFINQLRYYEIIERKIASKSDKLTYHFKKWTNLLSILRDD